jgi:hypothetical protein
VNTPNRGLLLKPYGVWDGDPKYEFIIKGRSDATYASVLTNSCSITRYLVFLNGTLVAQKSRQQKSVTCLSAEAELASRTGCAQDMLYVMQIMELIGLPMQKPMILKIDNKGAVRLANNWSIGRQTRHIKVHFLWELKEDGIIHTKWLLSGEIG